MVKAVQSRPIPHSAARVAILDIRARASVSRPSSRMVSRASQSVRARRAWATVRAGLALTCDMVRSLACVRLLALAGWRSVISTGHIVWSS